MNSEGTNTYLIKTTNPVISNLMTYKTYKPVILIGSDSSCELILSLPSISAVHLIVDFQEKKLKAIGNDVRCDYISVAPESTISFTNKSLISIHNIFFMFLSIADNNDIMAEVKESEQKLLNASSKYTYYSPYLRITPSNESMAAAPEYDLNIQSNREGMVEKYKKEMGEFSEMPPLTQMHDYGMTNPIVKKVEEDFENRFDTTAPPSAVAAVIQSQLINVKENVQKAIDGITDIGVVREEIPDLGKSAIENEILKEAKKEVDQAEKASEMRFHQDERNKLLEAELKSIDDLRTSITDSIKEEFRSTISDLIQEETKEHVGKEVERCFQEPKFTQFVSETVAEHSKAVIEEVKNQIEDLKEAQDKIIEATNHDTGLESNKKPETPKDISDKEVSEVEEQAELTEHANKSAIEEKKVTRRKNDNVEDVSVTSQTQEQKKLKTEEQNKIQTRKSTVKTSEAPKKKKAELQTSNEEDAEVASTKRAKKQQVSTKKEVTDSQKVDSGEKPTKKAEATKVSTKNVKEEKTKKAEPIKEVEEKPKGRVSERKQSKVASKKATGTTETSESTNDPNVSKKGRKKATNKTETATEKKKAASKVTKKK